MLQCLPETGPVMVRGFGHRQHGGNEARAAATVSPADRAFPRGA